VILHGQGHFANVIALDKVANLIDSFAQKADLLGARRCAHTGRMTGLRASLRLTLAIARRGRLATIVVVVLISFGVPVAAGADANSAHVLTAQPPASCYLSLAPSSGPVGTLVSITGSTASCRVGGGDFGFFDEDAAIAIAGLPGSGLFSFDFRIPATMPSGQFDSAVLDNDGGGPVGPGSAGFLTNMGAPLDEMFDVTSAPPGWDDYSSISATNTLCNGCTTGTPVYNIVRSDGFLETFGPVTPPGNAGSLQLKAPVVGSAITANADGYWMVGADGGVFSFGDAGFYGSLPAEHVTPAEPIVGIAATANGKGYWLVGADGGVFSFGNAGFYGSLPAEHVTPAEPIVGIAATTNGKGYWLVGADGGVFSFGNAAFFGSMGGKHLNAPIVAIAASPGGHGYWLAARDGGVFTFGRIPFEGSAADGPQQFPMVSIAPTSSGMGYWLLGRDGGVFAYGDAKFLGSGRGPG
jgi:hypothetical protein